jgi:LytS/YehU family sensor histidine kinase
MNALQSQVNPHFLFNSFHWLQLKMEEMNAEPGFCEAIAALSEVYRYNLSSQRFATLEEELKHVNAYVLYMQAVKGNKISLSVNCENRLYFVKLPRFTLQPILENAIKHGIENGNELCVAIDVQIKCDYLIICVNNNGKRIPDDRLAYINNDLLKDVSTDINESVGLKNLALRLRLSYGDSVQISINSNDDLTCIRLKIPLIIYRDHDSKEEI